MKRTFITALAAMMLCIPAVAESHSVSDVAELSAEKKETKKKNPCDSDSPNGFYVYASDVR